jgi:hypothetical protein
MVILRIQFGSAAIDGCCLILAIMDDRTKPTALSWMAAV